MKNLTLLLLIALFISSCQQTDQTKNVPDKFPVLKGDYLGQELPGDSAVLFAPDGDEIFFCVSIGGFKYTAILCSKRVNGVWTAPEVVSFSKVATYQNFEPALSADGNQLFFLSTRD